MSTNLDDARAAVNEADAFRSGFVRDRAIRDALRALIQEVEELRDRVDRLAEHNNLWDGT